MAEEDEMTGMVCRLRRALALGGLLLLGVGSASQALLAQQRVGVDSAVNPAAMESTGRRAEAPGAGARRRFQRTDHDRGSGPDAGLVCRQVDAVDRSEREHGDRPIRLRSKLRTGKLAASLTRGVFRFVGGKISKLDNAVTLHTPSATIGIRGGVILVRVRQQLRWRRL